MKPTTVRPYRPGDDRGILDTFNLVFREACGEGYVDRSLDYWRWQFLDNPEGLRISIAVTDDGLVTAHYGGVPYRVATVYGDKLFIHIVDSFVHPEYRKGLKRPGLFVDTAVPWFSDCYIRGDAVPYGYPVRIAERIGQRFLNYNHMRIVNYLCRDLQAQAAVPEREGPAGIEVRRVDVLGIEVNDLFERFAAERPCLVRRSVAYLTWRYLRPPGIEYEIYEARSEGQLRGLMVMRAVHELIPAACTIADWIVPGLDGDVTEALLARAVARGRECGRERLLAVFADTSVEFASFRELGFDLVPSKTYQERRLTFQIYDDDLTWDWLRENWWYTLGDSDLV